MNIPTRNECLGLMDRIHMPLHIKKHSLTVAAVALYLARPLKRRGWSLDLNLVEAAALLHDIAKARSIETGEQHHELGAQMITDLGYPALAPIIFEHISLDTARISGPITESLIVNYADKRVKHDCIVTIQDRFDDLIVRYGKTSDHREWLKDRLGLYILLERKIFERLTVPPAGTELMHLSVDFLREQKAETYDRRQVENCIIGRWPVG